MIQKSKRLTSLVRVLRQNKQVVLTSILLGVLGDILLIKDDSDLRIFGLLGLYFASILFYKIKSRFTFAICLIILAVMYIAFILSGTSEQTEKAAVWLFFFMLIGIIQQLRE